MYGVITLNGKSYVQRPAMLPFQQAMAGTLDINTPRFVFPGVADFMLLGMSRDTVVNGSSVVRRFRFRFGNSDGNVWYSQAPNGGISDRVVDSLVFGTGPFPYPLPAPVVFSANASMMLEFEDITNLSTAYTIYLNFIGTWILPT